MLVAQRDVYRCGGMRREPYRRQDSILDKITKMMIHGSCLGETTLPGDFIDLCVNWQFSQDFHILLIGEGKVLISPFSKTLVSLSKCVCVVCGLSRERVISWWPIQISGTPKRAIRCSEYESEKRYVRINTNTAKTTTINVHFTQFAQRILSTQVHVTAAVVVADGFSAWLVGMSWWKTTTAVGPPLSRGSSAPPPRRELVSEEKGGKERGTLGSSWGRRR